MAGTAGNGKAGIMATSVGTAIARPVKLLLRLRPSLCLPGLPLLLPSAVPTLQLWQSAPSPAPLGLGLKVCGRFSAVRFPYVICDAEMNDGLWFCSAGLGTNTSQ
jgi:hypothetical protein